jgi:hypothetical protein
MTTQADHRFYRMMKDNGSVTVTAVNFDTDEAVDHTFDHYEQGKADIEGLEYDNEVYF